MWRCLFRADLSQPLDYHGKLAAKHRQVLDVSFVVALPFPCKPLENAF